MTYFIWYAGVGLLVLALMLADNRLRRRRGESFAEHYRDAVHAQNQGLLRRILETIIVPVLAAVLAVLVWPVALVMLGKILMARKKGDVDTIDWKPRDFTVNRQHLQKPMSIAQIEATEWISEPLGAVPNLPFGHLNAAWVRFSETVRADDQVWSFSASWSGWLTGEVRRGYAILRADQIVAFFVTGIEPEASTQRDQATGPASVLP